MVSAFGLNSGVWIFKDERLSGALPPKTADGSVFDIRAGIVRLRLWHDRAPLDVSSQLRNLRTLLTSWPLPQARGRWSRCSDGTCPPAFRDGGPRDCGGRHGRMRVAEKSIAGNSSSPKNPVFGACFRQQLTLGLSGQNCGLFGTAGCLVSAIPTIT